jgi:hypothetical protein
MLIHVLLRASIGDGLVLLVSIEDETFLLDAIGTVQRLISTVMADMAMTIVNEALPVGDVVARLPPVTTQAFHHQARRTSHMTKASQEVISRSTVEPCLLGASLRASLPCDRFSADSAWCRHALSTSTNAMLSSR